MDFCYKNISYHNEHEYRWAIFFDYLQVKFDYIKTDGFIEKENKYYFPTFYFPKYNFFALTLEFDLDEFENTDIFIESAYKYYNNFMIENEKPIVIINGFPKWKPFPVIKFHNDFENDPLYNNHVMPFADLVKKSYGDFWICGGDEDWTDVKPFCDALNYASNYNLKSRFILEL